MSEQIEEEHVVGRLSLMPRTELQKIAKDTGIKANQKVYFSNFKFFFKINNYLFIIVEQSFGESIG